MDLEIGDIVLLKNIVFKKVDIDNSSIDHAILRPCVLVGKNEEEDSYYFLPITNSDINGNGYIIPNNYNRLNKISSLNIETIIRKPISFFNTVGVLSEKDMYYAYKRIVGFYSNFSEGDLLNDKEYYNSLYINNRDILNDVLNAAKEYINKYEDKKKSNALYSAKKAIDIINNNKKKNRNSNYNKIHLINCENTSLILDKLFNIKNCLLITESSDMLLSFILSGAKKIKAVDKNILTNFLFSLKKSAIISLKKEEYLDYFVPLEGKKLDVKLYDKLKDNLDLESRIFWDYLYDSKCDLSKLSIDEIANSKDAKLKRESFIENNYYMQGDNYNKLKCVINNPRISFYNLDISHLYENNKALTSSKYDFVDLSNVYDDISVKKFVPLIGRIRNNLLNKSGKLVCGYLYDLLLDEFGQTISLGSNKERLNEDINKLYKDSKTIEETTCNKEELSNDNLLVKKPIVYFERVSK